MDKTRDKDLEEITQAIKEARTQGERDYLEKIAYRIINTSAPIRSLREDLVSAVRVGDTRSVSRITAHINKIRQDETYGKSWGNDKGNKHVN